MTSSLPGLPVVDDNESFVATFGERECLAANFPAYAGLLQNGDIVPPALNEILAADPSDVAAPVAGYVNLANVAIGPEFSDLQIAVKFLHHQVAILPIVKEGKLEGVIRRDDFLEAVTGTAHN